MCAYVCVSLSNGDGYRGRYKERLTHTYTVEQRQAPGMMAGSVFSLDDKLNQSGVLCSNRVALSCFIYLPPYYLPLCGCLQRLGLLSGTVVSSFR